MSACWEVTKQALWQTGMKMVCTVGTVVEVEAV